MKPFKEAADFDKDLQAAYDYYKAYGVDTAERFLAAYAKGVSIIQTSPRPVPMSAASESTGGGSSSSTNTQITPYFIGSSIISGCWRSDRHCSAKKYEDIAQSMVSQENRRLRLGNADLLARSARGFWLSCVAHRRSACYSSQAGKRRILFSLHVRPYVGFDIYQLAQGRKIRSA